MTGAAAVDNSLRSLIIKDDAELIGRERLAKSQAEISRGAWLDESYVSRLFSGGRTNPSRDALILLSAFGLELRVEDVDDILLSAGYRPLVLPQTLR